MAWTKRLTQWIYFTLHEETERINDVEGTISLFVYVGISTYQLPTVGQLDKYTVICCR